jgi:hypothetical protein
MNCRYDASDQIWDRMVRYINRFMRCSAIKVIFVCQDLKKPRTELLIQLLSFESFEASLHQKPLNSRTVIHFVCTAGIIRQIFKIDWDLRIAIRMLRFKMNIASCLIHYPRDLFLENSANWMIFTELFGLITDGEVFQ